MQRSKKINEIRSLIDSINEKKYAITCTQLFYSNGVDLFMDSEHKIKTTDDEISAIAETERIENNAENVIKIIVHSSNVSSNA